VPFYICPNCKDRSIDSDGLEGFTQQHVQCRRCGFGFLFELMDDYYPAPTTGMVVCDASGRILAVGRGIFELSGYRDRDLMGHDVMEGLGLTGYEDGKDPSHLAREWGVRRMGERLRMRTRAGHEKEVNADFFPAYDTDGGLLVAITPGRSP
jgi:PAS domain S-box-containing protein